jgi:hypothetical protein
VQHGDETVSEGLNADDRRVALAVPVDATAAFAVGPASRFTAANSEVKAGLGWLISSPGHVAYDIHLFLASQIFS